MAANIKEATVEQRLRENIIHYLYVLDIISIRPLLSCFPESIHHTQLNKLNLTSKFTTSPSGSDVFNNEKKLTTALGRHGLSMEYFKNSLCKTREENPEKIFTVAIQEVINTFEKFFFQQQLSRAILDYTKLYKKFSVHYPSAKNTELYSLIDQPFMGIRVTEDDQEISAIYRYSNFSRAYQGKKVIPGFASIFSTEPDHLVVTYNITLELLEKFNPIKEAYTNLIASIEQLSIYAVNKQVANTLINQLIFLTDDYFSNLLRTNPDLEPQAAYENFKSTSIEIIKSYKETYPDELKRQQTILDHLLWLITKLIPSALFSAEKRMTLFGGRPTENAIQIKEITTQINKNSIKIV